MNYTCVYPSDRNLKKVPTDMSYANGGICGCDRRAFSGLMEVGRNIELENGSVSSDTFENVACKAVVPKKTRPIKALLLQVLSDAPRYREHESWMPGNLVYRGLPS